MGKPACLFAAESYYYGYYGSIQPDIGRSRLGGLSALFFLISVPTLIFIIGLAIF